MLWFIFKSQFGFFNGVRYQYFFFFFVLYFSNKWSMFLHYLIEIPILPYTKLLDIRFCFEAVLRFINIFVYSYTSTILFNCGNVIICKFRLWVSEKFWQGKWLLTKYETETRLPLKRVHVGMKLYGIFKDS